MTLRDALLISKENGESYMRPTGSGGFVSWHDTTVYEFTAEDLVADDWESTKTGIPSLTQGRWHQL